MRQAPPEYPDWARAWNRVMDTCAADWDTGVATEQDVFAEMSRQTGLSLAFVEQHADACCRAIAFNPVAWQTASERHRPQALVTVNCDLFISASHAGTGFSITSTRSSFHASRARQTRPRCAIWRSSDSAIKARRRTRSSSTTGKTSPKAGNTAEARHISTGMTACSQLTSQRCSDDLTVTERTVDVPRPAPSTGSSTSCSSIDPQGDRRTLAS